MRVMHWVDAGLNNTGVYPNEVQDIVSFARACDRYGIDVRVHASPRQLDTRRPWVEYELTQFVKVCVCVCVCVCFIIITFVFHFSLS